MTREEARRFIVAEYNSAVDRADRIGHKGDTRYMKILRVCLAVLDDLETIMEEIDDLPTYTLTDCHDALNKTDVMMIFDKHLKEGL